MIGGGALLYVATHAALGSEEIAYARRALRRRLG